ncbi:MAG: Addiction module toxin, RelE/StbE family [Candidatus Woesebacteria bacterium GW2011_GWB1_38_8]|uniref:Addiction module toxin, RelE/StbE family n=1 Tax=Candidatus Woesebacteria bacterium GW2011_GWB1_38_8 TaxID=1618570 RepID=A0A0G0L7F3_9BACT|nr:MAG: Addiction module toxin, RelE/StbE family [Candidatus Woesebacteria bacterium GW2011_GWB1_38_8]
MIKIKYTHAFKDDLTKLLTDEPNLKNDIDKVVSWFVNNPQDTRLGLHVLKKRLKGKNAIEITEDIRIIFEWLGKNVARFLAIGPHYNVYPGYKKSSKEKV